MSGHRPDADRVDPADLVAHLLGEGTTRERDAMRAAIRADVALAAECAETGDLLERMRELRVRPSGRVASVARAAARRRLELRGALRRDPRERLAWALRVAAVALVWLGISWSVFGDGFGALFGAASRGPVPEVPRIAVAAPPDARRNADLAAEQVEVRHLCDDAHLPIDDAGFVAAFRELTARPVSRSFEHWLTADNRLSRLRGEIRARFSPEIRRALRAATGIPDLERRIDSLGAELAARVDAALAAPGEAEPAQIAAALRGLLASGSALDRGPHRASVTRATEWILGRLAAPAASLDGAAHAELLVALTDAAIVDGSALGIDVVVAAECDELARNVLRRRADGRRPTLLSSRTDAALIADVGHVLQVAPAFGTHGGLAFRARLALCAHLIEREWARSDAEQPELVVAQLYGFGDLSDRAQLDQRLSLWRPQLLLPDYRALRQFAWSRYPVRPGWSGFQSDLRRIAGLPTPSRVDEAAGLLLVLCTNTAAPGILNVLAIAHSG